MIIDAHCHAWRRWPYDSRVPDPESRGSAEALLYEMDTHGVDHSTIVCARIGGGAGGEGFPNEDNNEYVSEFARQHSDRITAWIDVDSCWRREYHSPGSAERLRSELERFSARGFTHYFGAVNDGWLRTDEGREFFSAGAENGAIASLSVGAEWLDDLAEIAAANHTLPILLHHLSQPRLGTPHYDRDIAALGELANLPNIGVKVSGFNYNATRNWDFPYPEAQELFTRIHAMFGADRLYWGSDFPASRDMLTYTQAIEVLRTSGPYLSETELDLILGSNLARLLWPSQPTMELKPALNTI